MEKHSLPLLELGCRDERKRAVFAVHADETPRPTQTGPLPRLVRAQRSLCSLEQRLEQMSGKN